MVLVGKPFFVAIVKMVFCSDEYSSGSIEKFALNLMQLILCYCGGTNQRELKSLNMFLFGKCRKRTFFCER